MSIETNRDELFATLRDSLRIEVKRERFYTGDMDGESLYSDSITVQLTLDGEVISEACL
jgi:hypothetical protein